MLEAPTIESESSTEEPKTKHKTFPLQRIFIGLAKMAERPTIEIAEKLANRNAP